MHYSEFTSQRGERINYFGRISEFYRHCFHVSVNPPVVVVWKTSLGMLQASLTSSDLTVQQQQKVKKHCIYRGFNFGGIHRCFGIFKKLCYHPSILEIQVMALMRSEGQVKGMLFV